MKVGKVARTTLRKLKATAAMLSPTGAGSASKSGIYAFTDFEDDKADEADFGPPLLHLNTSRIEVQRPSKDSVVVSNDEESEEADGQIPSSVIDVKIQVLDVFEKDFGWGRQVNLADCGEEGWHRQHHVTFDQDDLITELAAAA
eukprot:TRINITY_DN23425_c0_g1_i1.p1 TRINITY_DN23425_c0_g1~~TRINITY_DN23425_c0_g1_i1.p1  ORF type:complete len:144 (-),score=46.53 TRINITY_DN23425_c0_g1_i1:606-1037(-)